MDELDIQEKLDFGNLLNIIQNMEKNISFYFAELRNQQSLLDQELNDIYHFIEFNGLSASKGYNAYKLLHTKLKIRRKIKNEISICQMFKASSILELRVGDKYEKWLEKRKHLSYKTRIKEIKL